MGVLTEAQQLLTRYLASLKMEKSTILYIVGVLWDEEATLEMLQYILETRETDPAKLFSTASKISKKYEKEEKEEEEEME